jgi:hypothetical protein
MHRKAIAASLTSGQSSGAVNSFSPSGQAAPLFQSTACFPNDRKSTLKFWISTIVCLCSAISLFAKPDPDLFDGRVTARSYDSESGSTAGSPNPGGGREGGEQRDIESVGDPGSGETVGSTSSKDSSTIEGGRESSGSAATQASDSTASSEHEASSAGGGSGGQEIRNFEDFGFGGVGAQETIEVNRSKESTSSANLLSDIRTLATGGNDYTSAAGQEASGGSQGGNGSLGGDHGTNLPSGL